MDVTVIVATFGGPEWLDFADRAAASAEPQAPVIRVHAGSLQEARNQGLARARTEWVIHLDGDDELEPGYIDAMAAREHEGDLLAPMVRYVRGERPRAAGFPRVAGHEHDCTADCLPAGNWLVIGTAVRAGLAREAGGWRDWPVYEDWCMWQRCWMLGGRVARVPDAVYRAHVRPGSRNRGMPIHERNQWHHRIVEANGLAGRLPA